MTNQQTGRQAEGTERLLRLERMMTDAYDNAMDKLNERELSETLAPFRARRQENAQTLQQLAGRAEGEAPQLDESFRRYVEAVLDTLDDAVRRDEAIGGLRIAEAALGMVYGQVAGETTDEQTAETIKRLMRDEAEHVRVLAMAHETSKT